MIRLRTFGLGRTGLHTALALATVLGTSACTTFGGNVSGDFACRAPGGSCAPMSSIDAHAVASVLGEGAARPGAPTSTSRLAGAGQPKAAPTRTGERTLRIVFPAYVDAAGVLHDEAIAHAVVEAPAWTFAPRHAPVDRPTPSTSPEFSRSHAPSLREAVAGASAPAIEGLEFPLAQAPHPIDGVDAPALPAPRPGPTPEALAAARAGHRIARPVPTGEAVAPPSRSSRNAKQRSEAVRVVRDRAKPALSKLDAPPASEPDLGNPFRPAPQTGSDPR